MPNCIIMGCPHKTGNNQKFPGIVLHSFPSSIERIKKWILQTGQVFQDPDTLANKIYEGKKTDTFRMCSAHFTKDSYIFTAQKRFLKHNALPAIFPQATEGKPLIDEQKIVGKRKKKSERLEAKNISSFICRRCLMSENIYEGKILVDAGTQTDNEVLHQPPRSLQAPVLPMTQAVLMLSVPLQSYCTPQMTPLIKQPAHTLGCHSTVGYNTQDLLKNNDIHGSLAATSNQSFPLVELSMSSHHNKDPDGMEESSPISEGDTLVPSQPNTESYTLQNIIRGRKLLVFEDCLDCLVYMVKCRGAPGCSKVVKRFNKEYRGSAVIIRGQCEDGHFFKIWESQPRVKRFFAGNILTAASVFFSGLKYPEACDFFNTLGLRHFSEKTYNYYQKYYFYPAVHEAWQKEHEEVIQEVQGKLVCLSGDRQYGTCGPNDEHCIYTLSDTITDKIVDFQIIQSTSCQSLTDLEKRGLEICMSRTIAEGVDVACFASDKHKRIVDSMKKNYAHVDHQFNVRHYGKSILKKLKAASLSKVCATIGPWIKHMYAHFLWSVQTCENNEDLLREKWLSLLHHIVNKHSWEEGELYKQCEHDQLSHQTLRETLWLQPGSPSFQKVKEIVTDPQLMKDLKHLTWNCHSMASSVFHSNLLKLKTRRPCVGLGEIEARVKLAALNHNQNVGRRKAEVRVLHSTSDHATRRKPITSRGKWLVRRSYEPISQEHLWPVMEAILEISEGTKATSLVTKAPIIAPSVTRISHDQCAKPRNISRFGFRKKKCEN